MIKFSLLFAFGSVIFLGCSKSPLFQDPKFAALSAIENSFKIVPTDAVTSSASLRADRSKISIEKSALEKEFLLQVQMLPQAGAPSFHGLESRIVSFRQQERKVYLVETSKGHNSAINLSQTLLLAEFDILEENDSEITLDFNKGMNSLFIIGDWRTNDSGGNVPDTTFTGVKVAFSFIEESKFTNNHLLVRQLAQIEIPNAGVSEFRTIEVQYYLNPYIENKNFEPTLSTINLDRVGFFEVSSLINKDGGITTYAAKRDIHKPIVYAISSNTPENFKQAIKDGILYWNRALGKELISVIEAPEGISAPNMDYNIVQWVQWDNAGFAYADAQMDPRTGEVLHQQIYFTSAWALIGQIQAKQLSKILGIDGAASTASSADNFRLNLAGFKTQQLCDMDLNQSVADQVGNVLAKGLTPEQALKAAQDLLREVVAHEVGHTLGLRHNFAGSLAANYSLPERENIFKKYVQTGSAPENLVTSSSVMDYQFPLESMLNGAQIAQALPAAEYDRKAMQTLYFGAHYKADEMPRFCTDSHASLLGIADCKPYDAGKSMIEWVQYQTQASIRNLPYTILFKFQDMKAPLFGMQPVPVEQLSLDAKVVANFVLSLEDSFMSLFPASAQLLSISRTFSVVNSSNEQIVRSTMETYVLNEIKKVGGLNKIFLHANLDFADQQYNRFEALLANSDNLKGLASSGKPFEFSNEEVATMKQSVKQFYKTLQKELIKQEAVILGTNKNNEKMQAGELADSLADYLAERENEIIFSTSKSAFIIKKTTNKTESWSVGDSQPDPSVLAPVVTTYTLPQFSYPLEVRQQATSFLKPDRSTDLVWGFYQKTAMQSKYNDFLINIFAPIGTMTADKKTEIKKYLTAPPVLISWLFDALTVKEAL